MYWVGLPAQETSPNFRVSQKRLTCIGKGISALHKNKSFISDFKRLSGVLLDHQN